MSCAAVIVVMADNLFGSDDEQEVVPKPQDDKRAKLAQLANRKRKEQVGLGSPHGSLASPAAGHKCRAPGALICVSWR